MSETPSKTEYFKPKAVFTRAERVTPPSTIEFTVDPEGATWVDVTCTKICDSTQHNGTVTLNGGWDGMFTGTSEADDYELKAVPHPSGNTAFATVPGDGTGECAVFEEISIGFGKVTPNPGAMTRRVDLSIRGRVLDYDGRIPTPAILVIYRAIAIGESEVFYSLDGDEPAAQFLRQEMEVQGDRRFGTDHSFDIDDGRGIVVLVKYGTPRGRIGYVRRHLQ